MIRMEAVTKHYGEAVAVAGLSIEVIDGEVCVLIGPSGCGKTTTLRMINRLVEPSAGRIYVNGEDTSSKPPELLRRTMGYAIQSVGLFPHMTVEQNISVVPNILGWDRSRIRDRVQELLHLVGLNPEVYIQKYPLQLSGGEAQRVGVARALAADPPILLMDEPFGAVDPLTRERLQQQFLNIQKELRKTVVLVTHDLDEAVRLADRVAVMREGRLVQFDTPERLLASPTNAFVRSFVGADRALKRLSRIPVTSLMHPAPTLRRVGNTISGEAPQSHKYAWVIDEDGHLLGWMDTRQAGTSDSVFEIDAAQMEYLAVPNCASAREALSRMLGQGVRSVPVVDASQHLLGEVNLHDIEGVTAE